MHGPITDTACDTSASTNEDDEEEQKGLKMIEGDLKEFAGRIK